MGVRVPGPAATTMPAASCPGVTGAPRMNCPRSEPHSALPVTRMSNCPSAGIGTGFFSTTILPSPANLAARIFSSIMMNESTNHANGHELICGDLRDSWMTYSPEMILIAAFM
jgi:hypothetical protein